MVEDDETTTELLDQVLSASGFDVEVVNDGEASVTSCQESEPDLVILDFELPGISGQETCRRIREFSDVYIVMLTSRADEIDKVLTLSLGADDYLTKPFSPQELVARARALMRRPRSGVSTAEEVSESEALFTLDDNDREIYADGKPVGVTQIEFRIATCLNDAFPEAVSRRELLERAWEDGFGGNTHMVDVHLSNLRRKLRDAGVVPDCIQNVRNVGFRIVRDRKIR